MKKSLLFCAAVLIFSPSWSSSGDILAAGESAVRLGPTKVAPMQGAPRIPDLPNSNLGFSLTAAAQIDAVAQPAPQEAARPEISSAREGLALPMDVLQNSLKNAGDSGALSSEAGADFMQRLGENWRSDSFEAEDGARIRYSVRPGEGPAVLLVHGRSVAGESFVKWAGAFPGRPLMVMERRGYNGSETGRVEWNSVYQKNSSDIERAIALAEKLGQGRRPGVLVYSLSAMLLPELDPKRVAWLALLNPGVYGMLERMPLETRLAASALLAYHANSSWNPFAAAGVRLAAQMMAGDVVKRVREAAGTKYARLGRWLAALLEARGADPRWKDLFVKESLWGSFGTRPARYLAAKIPLFFGLSKDDEVVPPEALDEFIAQVRKTARNVRVERRPGTHLSFVFEPASIIRALEQFDRSASQLPDQDLPKR